MICYRHADPRLPFLAETDAQPAARWHGAGEGPVQYLSDTPDGAWAELLRHEEIRSAEDLAEVRRALWAVEVPGGEAWEEPRLPPATLAGGPGSYPACREEAGRIRAGGAMGLAAPSAALRPGEAGGWRVDGGLVPGEPRDARTIALFGRRPDLRGWAATAAGRPREDLLPRVRHLGR